MENKINVGDQFTSEELTQIDAQMQPGGFVFIDGVEMDKPDRELEALKIAFEALRELPHDAAERCLDWLRARLLK